MPSASRPSSSGTSTCGPASAARTCDGAFSSPSSMCCQPQSSPTIALHRGLEVARDGRIGVLVDRHARGRVRHEDERGGGAVDSVQRCLDLAGDLDELRLALGADADLAHARYPTPVSSAAPPLTSADLDRFRERADRFIAELDEEYYLHYAGHKEKLELAPIYERFTDLTQLDQALALGQTANGDRGVRELWRFACEGYLGELTRDQAEKVAELEATLEADVDGETIPFRMLRPAMANEPDRDKRERIDKARVELTEEHLNPLHAEGVRIVREGVEQLEAPNYAELYRRFGFRLDELADSVPRAPRLDREALRGVGGQALPRPRRDRPRRGAALGRDPHVPRARVGSAVPGGEDAAGARGDARRHGHRPQVAGERRARRRAAAEEEPARVLRADRDPGPRRARDPADGRRRRLARPLPRGRPHRALREHLGRPLDGGEAARRRRGHRGLGDADAAPDGRPGLAHAAPRLPAARRVRARGRDAAPLHGAPLLGEAPVRDRVPRRRTTRRSSRTATSSCSATR